MLRGIPDGVKWTGLWLVLIAVVLATRPLAPIDETRYLSAAWEMWVRGDWLVPHLNGETYSHKPPLLFWLINLGWRVFGPDSIWGRLVGPLAGVAGVFLTAWLGRLLWPGRDVDRVAPWLLMATLLWAVTATLSMFDTLVMVCALIALGGVLRAAQGRWTGWLLFGLGVGFGVLAKGPVILVFTLPAALLAPLWLRPFPLQGWLRWYLGVAAGVLFGAAIALAWAIPAAYSGGAEYGRAIFLGQTTERVAGSMSHGRPVWFYLPMLVAILFPVLLWDRLWPALRAAPWRADRGLRFLLVWIGGAVAVLSAFTDKQPHYILPAVPAFALLAAFVLASLPVKGRLRAPGLAWIALGVVLIGAAIWGSMNPVRLTRASLPVSLPLGVGITGSIVLVLGVVLLMRARDDLRAMASMLAGVTVAALVAGHLFIVPALHDFYDLQPAADEVARAQGAGRPVAYVGKYHAQFQYLGRLRQPIDALERNEVREWFAAHPTGILIFAERRAAPDPGTPVFRQPFRSRELQIWQRDEALKSPDRFLP